MYFLTIVYFIFSTIDVELENDSPSRKRDLTSTQQKVDVEMASLRLSIYIYIYLQRNEYRDGRGAQLLGFPARENDPVFPMHM